MVGVQVLRAGPPGKGEGVHHEGSAPSEFLIDTAGFLGEL